MNILIPVSEIMTTNLVTVNEKDTLSVVKEKFDTHLIHHLPVVSYKKIVGMISKTDLLSFTRGLCIHNTGGEKENLTHLSLHQANEIMTKGLATIQPEEPLRTALELFKENIFHALPIVKNEELVGIVTTHDIIVALAGEKINLEDYQALA